MLTVYIWSQLYIAILAIIGSDSDLLMPFTISPVLCFHKPDRALGDQDDAYCNLVLRCGLISVDDYGDPDLLRVGTDYEGRLSSPSTVVVAVVVVRIGKSKWC